MDFFLWLLVIALGYFAIGRTLFLAITSATERRFGHVLLLFVGAAAAHAVTLLWVYVAARSGLAQVPRLWIAASDLIVFSAFLMSRDRIPDCQRPWKVVKWRKELSRQIGLHLALVTGAAVFSVPFYWLVTTSLKPDERTNIFPPDIIPMVQRTIKIGGEDKKVYVVRTDGEEHRAVKLEELPGGVWRMRTVDGRGRVIEVDSSNAKPDLKPTALWSNYRDALNFLPPEYRKGLVPLWNTIYVTALVILGTTLSSSLVGFSFARLRWPGRDLLFFVMIATMMVPGAVTMLPVFLIYRWLGWVDTLRPLWFGSLFGSGFNIFLLRQFFMTIPTDLEDAAKIDGCSYFRIYWNIMLPLIKPALAALTIFAFMGSWNNFMGPLIYISSPEKMTLAYALQLFQGAHGGEPAMMMAAATLVMLPVLAVFFFTQRYMIQGVTLTGLKG
ncbi:MAG: carbohydrate ABC transporter permease [Armatimonadota bacterium]|nr:carbohydrate ABC transporter permease [Armatimonadota bacterium]